jgi:hypothetical protein
MAKKRRFTKKREGINPETKPPVPRPEPSEDTEKKFDFGGLPDRNLKKNLGC